MSIGARSKALVLSGGGSVGIAWQTGLAAGLARAGVQLADADFIVGTSAGSAVGANLAVGADLDVRVRRYDAPSPQAARSASAGMSADRIAKLMAVMAGIDGATDADAGRAAVGKFALEAEGLAEDLFVAGFRDLADTPWPQHYACTAVDAESGAFVVWDAQAGAALDRAVASSCAVPGIFEPVTIKGRRYIDGGIRSGTNADLARGHDRVLIVSLLHPDRAAAANDPRSRRFARHIRAELDALIDAGARVEVIAPDRAAASTMGPNLMDAAIAPAAAQAGLRQGTEIADRLRTFWT